MKMLKVILSILVLFYLVGIVLAEPYGPNAISRDLDERGNLSGQAAVSVSAQGGNVTQITINGSSITRRWQGYYGNITGTIVLSDAQGNIMYDWTNEGFSAVGNIFAANQTVTDWTDVICLNLTADNAPAQGINASVLEIMYGMSLTDGDGVDETFAGTEDIMIGTTTLTNCPSTHIYQSGSAQSNFWNETLLTENQTRSVIYAAKVDQDTVGFDGSTWDFQMIVGDNGDIGTPVTSYDFYVELS